jgi:two-component system, NarL family, invasion response regulator UvrY
MTRVFILEDHAAVRQGFRLLLELEGIDICGEAENLDEARQGIRLGAPDLVMVDLMLGDENGLDLVRELAQADPWIPSLVVSMHGDGRNVRRALQAGAMGYVTKRETMELLAGAIRTCLGGCSYLSPKAALGLSDSR